MKRYILRFLCKTMFYLFRFLCKTMFYFLKMFLKFLFHPLLISQTLTVLHFRPKTSLTIFGIPFLLPITYRRHFHLHVWNFFFSYSKIIPFFLLCMYLSMSYCNKTTGLIKKGTTQCLTRILKKHFSSYYCLWHFQTSEQLTRAL